VTEPTNTNWAAPEGSAQAPAQSPAAAPAPQPAFQPAPYQAAPAPAPAPIVAPKKKSGALVNVVLIVAALVAVGGIAFAVGRTTAPAQATGFRGGQFGGLPGASFNPALAGQPGQGGFPGFGDRTMSISGTVKSIDGTTMVITTSSGNETTVDLSGASYHSQASATAADVKVGSTVSVATEGFGGRRPDASSAPDASGAPAGVPGAGGTVTATDVTITSGQ
jgi:hypothetical protein